MNFKKLVIIIPVVLLFILLFSKSATPTNVTYAHASNIDIPHHFIQASDYKSPHSGKIQTSPEIYSQTIEPKHELKKIQQLTFISAVSGRSNPLKSRELKHPYHSVALIPFYISYCTIMV